MRRLSIALIPVLLLMISCSGKKPAPKETPEMQARSYDVNIFYYPSYGTPDKDGEWVGWTAGLAGESSVTYKGGTDIASSFYPLYGCYSSHDPKVIESQMGQIASAQAGVVCVSWRGRGSFEDRAVPIILDTAAKYSLKVDFLLEPYDGRTPGSVEDDIRYLVDTYGSHKAFFRTDRFGKRPMFFVNAPDLSDPAAWSSFLQAGADGTIRGTKYDAIVLGVWKDQTDGEALHKAGFDGYFTWSGAPGSAWGSKSSSWEYMAQFGWENRMIFVPCISPGYDDTRIRPGGSGTIRDRDRGQYYSSISDSVVRLDPAYICIASFNKWDEGTQIEPARPMSIPGFVYRDYQDQNPFIYLSRTMQWIKGFSR